MTYDPHKVTRLTEGLSTEAPGSTQYTGALGEYVNPDPTKAYQYFNDFMVYTAGDWTITQVDGGGDTAEVRQIASDGLGGGVLTLTTNDADNDSESLQLKGESFYFVSGKRAWFKARFKLSDATQSDLLLGLVLTDTTPLAFTDGVVFKKDDGDASLDFSSLKDSAGSTDTAIATLADDTFVTAEFYFDGTDFHLYVNGSPVALIASATIPDNEPLTPTIHIQAGEAAAKTLSLDYIFAAIER